MLISILLSIIALLLFRRKHKPTEAIQQESV